MAHCLTQDDEYAGYHLPAGAMVMPNIWAMLHAPDVYTDPEAFRPERFLGPAPEPDPRKLAFGFGRRACPGQALAETSVWLSCALVLATLRIRPVKDAAGRDVLPEATMQNGMTSHPEPFPCEITPRSEHARELIFAIPYADEEA
jgi:cytochrome P450